jgi:amino acid permease
MTILLTLHSILRWVIVLVALAVIIKFALGLVQKQPYDKSARGLASAFGGLMDTQLLLGTVFFIWSGLAIQGGFGLRHRWEHLAVMLVAVIVAHLPAMWKQRDDQTRYRNGLVAILVSILLVVVGVFALPGNRWLNMSGF